MNHIPQASNTATWPREGLPNPCLADDTGSIPKIYEDNNFPLYAR
jgi:hypothetical protein